MSVMNLRVEYSVPQNIIVEIAKVEVWNFVSSILERTPWVRKKKSASKQQVQ